jgi:DNA polymerase epsilon subunit 1
MDDFKPGLQKYTKACAEKKVFTPVVDKYKEDRMDFESIKERNMLDLKMGFPNLQPGFSRTGWLVNIQPTLIDCAECVDGLSGIDLYFIEDDGKSFKTSLIYNPYFYVETQVF